MKPFGVESGGIANHRGNARHGDFAFFPGSGPGGTWCDKCGYFTRKLPKTPKDSGRCLKAAELRGVGGNTLRPIKAASASCKYFERKP